jgi:hypothetical protein
MFPFPELNFPPTAATPSHNLSQLRDRGQSGCTLVTVLSCLDEIYTAFVWLITATLSDTSDPSNLDHAYPLYQA